MTRRGLRKGMRISFVLPEFAGRPMGGYLVVYEYANRLAARGHAVTVVHPRGLPGHLRETPPAFVPRWRWRAARLHTFVRRPRPRWFQLDPAVRVLHVATPSARDVPDGHVVFATAWQTAESVVEYPESKGTRFYLVQDGHLGPVERIEETWSWPFEKVAVSRWLEERIRSVDPERVTYIPNGVEASEFRCVVDPANRGDKVLFSYSPVPYKGTADVLKALRRLRAALPSVKATAFGAVRRPADLPGWVEYRTDLSRAALGKLYNEAAVFLWGSPLEGFALPPAEAMACGCAVATTDCAGNRDYAEDEVTALVSPPGDPVALATNALWLLEDTELRLRLARAGRERIAAFDWTRSTDRLESLLREKSNGAATAPPPRRAAS